MEYYLDLKNVEKKNIHPISQPFAGKDLVNRRELSFTNYYMQMNGKPFMGISGECHYSRVHEDQWEDTILKMKMSGINIISTYIFWIHHEEEEGKFRFDGNRNIRKFLELCKKHDMLVIVRIGPFDHGEVRNGGLPDWLYGKPFEVRSLNEGFLGYTRKLYCKLAQQFEGLYFQDGGPIIGTQIENEYMHSAAPWEMTTGITNEWIPGGSDGDAYMITLKRMAQEEGIQTPFYTCTGWGGAAAPVEEMLPLWGGYAFWPWIFYDYRGEHPATPEYIYRDNHNNAVLETYNFKPTYEPESLPYACCEMGGGMSCYYHYRFQLPFESVDAMANIKLASGCNFLGYYMYRGGSNPKGEKTLYLNECQCPKISYDYQAAIGEFGQLRPSYYRLKALHQFMTNFSSQLCNLKTVLPENSQDIQPENVDTLRYAVRTDGERGFVFLNNYQDHVECRAKKEQTIILKFHEKEIRFENLSIAAGEEAVLPFEMDVEGYRLVWASAQPLSVIKSGDHPVYFFFSPEGMNPVYVWNSENLSGADGKTVTIYGNSDKRSSYVLNGKYGMVEIVTLTRAESLMFYEILEGEEKKAILCDSPLQFDGERLLVESPKNQGNISHLLCYPEQNLVQETDIAEVERYRDGIFSGLRIKWNAESLQTIELETRKVGNGRYTLELPKMTEKYKDVFLQIDYQGDIGHLFADGELLSDNFCNGATWEIGMKEVWKKSYENLLTVFITPLKSDAIVDVSSTMAGRMEQLKNSIATLDKAILAPVQEIVLRLK